MLLLFSHPVMSNSLRSHGLYHSRPPCPSPFPKVCPSSCPLHQWCHPAISSSDVPFSFCPQSFPASGTFPMSQLFTSGDQNTGASASASVLPVNIQGWFTLWLTGLTILLSKGLSGVFSNTMVQFSSVTQSCLTLCSPMECSTSGLPTRHHLPKFSQVHVHCISDAIQPSHPLTPSSPSLQVHI